ncbi:hypothetical protein GQ55_1G230700 [Panicum hallii var. hallii]|uniref:Uncharacterized protein n=1 Tax=Panicum hallii var. hallii TaxID=1504633 RepID=A0A2T7F6N7_9POAL|nr:hypothetical protein GQ55_1G230700 [Panicum hallii var. hallii]
MEHNRNCVSREPFADLTNTGGIVDVDSKELKEADGASAFCFSIRRSEKRA